MNIIIATDNDWIDKEPAKILIDSRLDKVKDEKQMEKDSNINNIISANSNLVKNKYDKYGLGIKPKYPLYINQLINTIIIPDKYISIILLIIKEIITNIFILIILIEYPTVISK